MPKAQTQKNKVNNLLTPSPTPPKLLPAKAQGKEIINLFPGFSREKPFGLLSIFISLPPVLHAISLNSFKLGDEACSFG